MVLQDCARFPIRNWRCLTAVVALLRVPPDDSLLTEGLIVVMEAPEAPGQSLSLLQSDGFDCRRRARRDNAKPSTWMIDRLEKNKLQVHKQVHGCGVTSSRGDHGLMPCQGQK